MSNEISMFEKLGGTYTEVDGILYPNIGMDDIDTKSDMDLVVTSTDIGKYGHLWISYMKENHSDRYRHHIRLDQLLIKPKDAHSTMEMWKIREQAKQLAEEVIYGEIVYKYH